MGTADYSVRTAVGTPDGSLSGPYAAVTDTTWPDPVDVAPPSVGTPTLLSGAAAADDTQAAIEALVVAVNADRAALRAILAVLRTSGVMAT